MAGDWCCLVHDRGLGITSGLESGNDSAGGGDVDGGDSESLLTGVGEKLQNIIACSTDQGSISDSPISERGVHTIDDADGQFEILCTVVAVRKLPSDAGREEKRPEPRICLLHTSRIPILVVVGVVLMVS